MKRQGQASNSSGLGRIAPCRIQIRQGATIVQSQEDDGAECQSWSNRAINKHLPNVRGEERCTLLPMAGDVDNPMLSRSLLFIMSLVLRGGIRIIYNGSTDTAVFAIVNNPSVGGIG